MNRTRIINRLCILFGIQLFAACHPGGNAALFTLLTEKETGIHFRNTLTESDSLNALTFPNIYHGAGVGIGDFNNDGLPDVFFGANMESSRLYLNNGNFTFSDKTLAAGLTTHQWISGVTVVDINNDGWKDIYLCVAAIGNKDASNLLYINQGLNNNGEPGFREMAAAYGLDYKGYSTQSAFFDYDLDGDLDMYLLNNGIAAANENYIIRPKRLKGESPTTDCLFRNEGGSPHPHFTNVTAVAGLGAEGFGLGLAISDINRDGFPDIYISNDYISSDQLWINNGNGTFTDHNNDYLQHTSLNGMGVDIADINNDGWNEIMQVDMLPPDNFRRKMMLTKPDYNSFKRKQDLGYQAQFVRNTLQLNNGRGPDSALHFSEIAQFSGVAATDWSWASLVADFDNDGWKDMYISNGYRRNITDLDFIVHDYKAQNRFGSAAYKKSTYKEQLLSLPEIRITDLFYHNNADLTFSDSSTRWGISEPSFSTGAAYADLDNDGDLDMVVNVIDGPAMVYRNNSRQHALRIRLHGDSLNPAGIGARIQVNAGGQTMHYEHFLSRGYLSSMDEGIVIGIGNANMADSVRISWPGGRGQVLYHVRADSIIQLQYVEAKPISPVSQPGVSPLLEEAGDELGVNYIHQEPEYLEFDRNALVPYNLSVNGPCMATGDINGDGLEDIFIGGSGAYNRHILYQQPGGTFKTVRFPYLVQQEDVAAILVDVDNDKDADLYVVSGSTENPANSPLYQDKLYLNEGAKGFIDRTDLVPAEHFTGSCVAASDYDGDGDTDLFVGAGYLPGSYPFADRSMLLQNNGGRFVDVTRQIAPELLEGGTIQNATWADMDGDGDPDLVTAGPFAAVGLYLNEKGSIRRSAETGDLSQTGWWTTVLAGDIDGDGDLDLVAGNLGTNTHFKAAAASPLNLYAKDFDRNGSIDPVIGVYYPGQDGRPALFPEVTRDQIIQQLPSLRKNFERYEHYAAAGMPAIFGKALDDCYHKSITTLTSTCFENLGNGQYRANPLPPEAQYAPIHAILLTDINNDKIPDLIAGGNEYAWDTRNGYTDASYGYIGLGTGKGELKSVPWSVSGFWTRGDVRSIKQVKGANGKNLYLAAINQGKLRVFRGR